MLEVVLPFGVADGRGGRARRAVLNPINGKGELLSAAESNPFRAGLALLAESTTQLGPFWGRDLDFGVFSSLLPVDRDFLLLQLNRLSFGNIRFQTVQCPSEGCGKRVDVQFDLSTVEPPKVSEEARGQVMLGDGRELHFRLPTSGDQSDMHGIPPHELAAALIERCVHKTSEASLAVDDVMALPLDIRTAVVREVLSASPEFDMQLELACIECGNQFRFVYDPVHSLLGELRASRSAVLREVHYLAFYYHWSHDEILGLSRSLRREYLALLDEELTKQSQGVLR